ncbi:DUF7382 domain-containing protein [Halorhabdus rudnickae]|uniref:DUF7382 domain-containing protein n=1 Tax=Halorhabdus rudnickae TaxID=1775544 RepID=UPI001AEFBBB8|nr:hypothetical protein [Halorhabdus rudnickae]
MQILGTFDFGADQEVDIEFNNAVVQDDGSSKTITVVDDKTGDPIPEADVIVRGDTLSIAEPYTATTNSDGKISFTVGDGSGDVAAGWRTTQETGKIRFEVVPPADSPYTDDQANDKMTVIRSGSP